MTPLRELALAQKVSFAVSMKSRDKGGSLDVHTNVTNQDGEFEQRSLEVPQLPEQRQMVGSTLCTSVYAS